MTTHVVPANFTDQGVRNAKDSPMRADAFEDMARKCGAIVRDGFWTQGANDIVTSLKLPMT
jgi:uncharacterized protein with GYD domain